MKPTLKLRSFQHDAIWFLINRKSALLALPTGTGKTITAFSTYSYLKDRFKTPKLIYITEKPLIQQTISQDLPKYFNLSYTHIYNNTKSERNIIYQDFVRNRDVLILNYHSVRIDFDTIGKYLKSIDFNFITIMDEATNIKNPNADITKCIKTLSKASKRVYAMTATPASSGLYDIFNIMQTIGTSPYKTKAEFDRMHCDFQSRKMFYFRASDRKFMAIGTPTSDNRAQQIFVSLRNKLKLSGGIKMVTRPVIGAFVVLKEQNGSFKWIVPNEVTAKSSLSITHKNKPIQIYVSIFDDRQHTGYKNLKIFRQVASDIMFVRAKKEIVNELPPITISYRYCEESIESKQTIKKLYQEQKVSSSQIEIAGNTPQVYNKDIPEDFICDKFKQLLHFIEDDIPTSKVIVYYPYTSTTNILRKYLSDNLTCKVAYATGEVKDTQSEVQKFLSDPETRVLIGTRTILKGLNIQDADYIAVLQSPYTASDTFQLWGRINRIGGNYTPKNVVYFLNSGTRDEAITENVIQQINHIREINPSLVEDTIGLLSVSGSLSEDEAKKALDRDLETRKTLYI